MNDHHLLESSLSSSLSYKLPAYGSTYNYVHKQQKQKSQHSIHERHTSYHQIKDNDGSSSNSSSSSSIESNELSPSSHNTSVGEEEVSSPSSSIDQFSSTEQFNLHTLYATANYEESNMDHQSLETELKLHALMLQQQRRLMKEQEMENSRELNEKLQRKQEEENLVQSMDDVMSPSTSEQKQQVITNFTRQHENRLEGNTVLRSNASVFDAIAEYNDTDNETSIIFSHSYNRNDRKYSSNTSSSGSSGSGNGSIRNEDEEPTTPEKSKLSYNGHLNENEEYETVPADSSLHSAHNFFTSPVMKDKVKAVLDFQTNTVAMSMALSNLNTDQKNSIFQLLATASSSDINFEQNKGEIVVRYKVKTVPKAGATPPAAYHSEKAPAFHHEVSNHSTRMNIDEKSSLSNNYHNPAQSFITNKNPSMYPITNLIHPGSEPDISTNVKTKKESSSVATIRSLEWVLRFIDDVYNSRFQCFLNEIATLDGSVETFSSFVFNFVSKKFGLDSLVKQAAFELLESVKHYRFSNKQVELFGLFLTPYYSAIDIMFFLFVRSLALHECVSGDRLPFENKRRQKKIGNTPQYIPGPRISYLTKKALHDQPKALLDNCMKELNAHLKKTNASSQSKRQLLSSQNKLFKEGKLELYEYLIILLIHYKAFRDAKNSKGKQYFYTLMPEEVPVHHRRRDPKIQQYILLRETQFHRNLLTSTLIKQERQQSVTNPTTETVELDESPRTTKIMENFLHDLSSVLDKSEQRQSREVQSAVPRMNSRNIITGRISPISSQPPSTTNTQNLPLRNHLREQPSLTTIRPEANLVHPKPGSVSEQPTLRNTIDSAESIEKMEQSLLADIQNLYDKLNKSKQLKETIAKRKSGQPNHYNNLSVNDEDHTLRDEDRSFGELSLTSSSSVETQSMKESKLNSSVVEHEMQLEHLKEQIEQLMQTELPDSHQHNIMNDTVDSTDDTDLNNSGNVSSYSLNESGLTEAMDNYYEPFQVPVLNENFGLGDSSENRYSRHFMGQSKNSRMNISDIETCPPPLHSLSPRHRYNSAPSHHSARNDSSYEDERNEDRGLSEDEESSYADEDYTQYVTSNLNIGFIPGVDIPKLDFKKLPRNTDPQSPQTTPRKRAGAMRFSNTPLSPYLSPRGSLVKENYLNTPNRISPKRIRKSPRISPGIPLSPLSRNISSPGLRSPKLYSSASSSSLHISSKAYKMLMGDPRVHSTTPSSAAATASASQQRSGSILTNPSPRAVYTPSYYKNRQRSSPGSIGKNRSGVIMSRKAHKLLIGGKSPQANLPNNLYGVSNSVPTSPLVSSPPLTPRFAITNPHGSPVSFNKKIEFSNYNTHGSSGDGKIPAHSLHRYDSASSRQLIDMMGSADEPLRRLPRSRSVGSIPMSSMLSATKSTKSPLEQKQESRAKGFLKHFRVKALKKRSKKKERLSDSSKHVLALEGLGNLQDFHVKRLSTTSSPRSPTRFSAVTQAGSEDTITTPQTTPRNTPRNADLPQLEFLTVLGDEHYRSMFHKFCKQELSTENIDFWQECLKFEKWSNKKQRLIHAKQLYVDYISPKSPYSLNIDIHAVNKIRSRIQACERNTGPLEETLADCFKTVKMSIEVCMSDTYHRFKSSPLYREMIMYGPDGPQYHHHIQHQQSNSNNNNNSSSSSNMFSNVASTTSNYYSDDDQQPNQSDINTATSTTLAPSTSNRFTGKIKSFLSSTLSNFQ